MTDHALVKRLRIQVADLLTTELAADRNNQILTEDRKSVV